MNPAVIARSILTRLQADSTLYTAGDWTSALAGGASFNKANPQGLTYPFIVYSVDWSADNNFNGMEGPLSITFTIIDTDNDGTSKIEVLIDRLIGDSMLSSGARTLPTYGFHNYKLATPSLGSTNVQGITCSEFNLESASISPGDTVSVNQATVTFSARAGNQAANV